MFSDGPKADLARVIDVKTLHAKTGELALENDFLSGVFGLRRFCYQVQKMIDPSAKLSVSRQAIVLVISRGSV